MGVSALAQGPTYRIGRAPTPEEIKALDISIGPTGEELPPGKGNAKEGATLDGISVNLSASNLLDTGLPDRVAITPPSSAASVEPRETTTP